MNNTGLVTAGEARALERRDLYFAPTGVGDQLMFLAAAERYFQKTGEKLLLAHQYPELAGNSDSSLILAGADSETVERLYVEQSQAKKNFTGRSVLIDGVEFNLKYVSYYDLRVNRKGLFINRLPDKHILARLCERLGLAGEIEIAPRLNLDGGEKEFGRLSGKRQIALMTGGKMRYKHFPPGLAGAIIEALGSEYDFVQLGGVGDPPLAGARPLMGKLTLRQTAAVLYNSVLFVGAIGGLMHLARAVGCPSVIAFAAEPLASEYYTTNSYVFASVPCAECAEGRLDPFYDPCPHEYRCLSGIGPGQMIAAVREKLSAAPAGYPPQTASLTPAPVAGLELWHRYRVLAAQRMGTADYMRWTHSLKNPGRPGEAGAP